MPNSYASRQYNPFYYGDAIPPQQFVGRWPLVEKIARDLTLDQHISYVCIGGRRFGKSSLLSALHHTLRRQQTSDNGLLPLPILIDMMHIKFESETTFFAFLLKEVCERVDRNFLGRIPRDKSPVRVPLEAPQVARFRNHDTLTLSQFEQALSGILDQLEQEQCRMRFIFLLDEIDCAFDYPWHQDLFQRLRALLTNQQSLADEVRLVLAGSGRILDEVSKRGSPLCNIFQLRYLAPFDEAATYELIQKFPGLSAAVQQTIWQQSGGHPFLTQYILYHLWEEGIEQVDTDRVLKIVNRFLHEEQLHLDNWAQFVGVLGLQVYGELTNHQDWLDELKLIPKFKEQNVKRALVDLCYHGFIIQKDQMYYRCAGDLLRTWYHRSHHYLITAAQAFLDSPPGIPSQLYNQLCHHLLNCGYFDSDRELKALFIEGPLYPWRNSVPEATNPTNRVTSTVSFLYDNHNNKGENALVLLLHVLSTRINPENSLHSDLAKSAIQLEQHIAVSSGAARP